MYFIIVCSCYCVVCAVSLQFKRLCKRIDMQYNKTCKSLRQTPTDYVPSVFYQELQKIHSIVPQSPTNIPTDCVPSVFYRELQKNYSMVPQSLTAIPDGICHVSILLRVAKKL